MSLPLAQNKTPQIAPCGPSGASMVRARGHATLPGCGRLKKPAQGRREISQEKGGAPESFQICVNLVTAGPARKVFERKIDLFGEILALLHDVPLLEAKAARAVRSRDIFS
ncbi:MAG: hypothetical protein K8T25_07945 [Planctomycetia bacterium]|nr:hypothetical protein [Planctomycetia bacterium]